MSLIKCPKCGEMFSDSYKTCPFCEEDEAYYGGRVKKTRGRRAAENRKRRAPSILGPAVVVVLVLLAALVVWLIFGDQIKAIVGGNSTPVEDVVQPGNDNTIDKPDDTVVTPAISLNRTVLALTVGDKETLTVNGTEETVSWESSDPTLVSVTSGGEVTALAKGTAIITARVGDEAVTCTVTVAEQADTQTPDDTTTPTGGDSSTTKPDTTKPSGNTSTTKVDVSKLTLESVYGTTISPNNGSFDISMSVSEPSCQFTVKGTSMTATWSGGSSSVATVTSDGTIKPVGRGETTLTIKIGSTEIPCLVRVTG